SLMNEVKFNIEPIIKKNLENVSMKCWDNREQQLKILDNQGALGLAAFDNKGDCIGLVHFYKITFPNWNNSFFPDYAKKRLEDWPLGWPLLVAKKKELDFSGQVLGIACFHVGVYKRSYEANKTYFNKGIGRNLLASVTKWAKEQKYFAVIGIGGSNVIPEYNNQMGCLPYKEYEKLGFKTEAFEVASNQIPWWVDQWGGKVKKQYNDAKEKNIDSKNLCSRLMVLNI
ncbi:MAG: hypothetical protein K8S18_12350, partial [Desulfobacula sp.]|nr:hypothetical protein [Desulfobacula sp.]